MTTLDALTLLVFALILIVPTALAVWLHFRRGWRLRTCLILTIVIGVTVGVAFGAISEASPSSSRAEVPLGVPCELRCCDE